MQITVEPNHGIFVVCVQGELVVRECEQLPKNVVELLRDNSRRIVLDLKGVTLVDSSGIGAIVDCYKMVLAANETLKFLVPERLHKTLTQMHMTMILDEVYPDLNEAIKSFNKPTSGGI